MYFDSLVYSPSTEAETILDDCCIGFAFEFGRNYFVILFFQISKTLGTTASTDSIA